MKGCSEECEKYNAICDFCKYYDFNGNEGGGYTGDGYCNLYKVSKEPFDDCKRFYCKNIEEEKHVSLI